MTTELNKCPLLKGNLCKVLLNLLLALLIMISLGSCEGFMCADGIVYDKSTNLPLDSVLIEVITANFEEYTDSVGVFDVCNRMGHCFPDCKEIVLRFSKKGYETITLINPDIKVILLEKK